MPGVTEEGRVPSLRGRIERINGVPVESAHVAPEARWALGGDRGLTYAAAVPKGSRVVAGEWWPADYHGRPLLSFDADLAHGMGLKLGDTLTVNVLGRELTATIANLREIDWTSLGINFAIVLSPGALDGAPQTDIAHGAHAPDERGGARARRHRPLPQRLGHRGQGRAREPRADRHRRSAPPFRRWRRWRSRRARWCWPAPSPRASAAASTTPSC